jgi:diguanylate cyclase (GGDEF)-like protein
LIVEDNLADFVLIREALSANPSPVELVHVERLCDAELKLVEQNFDVVLLDLSLPDSHGLDSLTRLLGAITTCPPIVVMTGLDDETVALRAVQAGAQDYLVKGQLDPRTLMRILRSAMERHRMMRDLDSAKRREHHLATHHPLTELPNRYLFYDRLEQALAGARRNGKCVAVLFLDIDRFKSINDTLGHGVGDQILQEVARRLCQTVRSSDTAAHLAGDEFTVILSEISKAVDAAKVVQNITEALGRPFELENRELDVTASIGVAVFPDDGEDAETLINNADTAMYQAKKDGRNGHRFYASEMHDRARERMALENDLRGALERNELRLYYQPKVHGATGEIVAAEALIRWLHPKRGMVPPLDFIPLAEETRMIDPIGEWVIHEACRQKRAWQDAGLLPLAVSVNVSPLQFVHSDLVSMIRNSLETFGLRGDCLELEITESCLMNDVSQAIETLMTIKALNVEISLDDFGTGYSSLSVLQRLPLDTLKIDRSFVCDSTTDPDAAMITSAIISLANNLDLKIVAEGVEDADQCGFLLDLGAPIMQGYLFSPPLPADDFEALLRRGPIRPEKLKP